jgi:hypothetical protein
MSNKDGLSVTRQADRLAMASRLEQLLTRCGAGFERHAGGVYPGPKCIRFSIEAARGLCVGVSFDGDSWQPNTYVLSWHMKLGSTDELNEVTFGGSVNSFHRQKATYVAHGFADLCQQLEQGLSLATEGEGISGAKRSDRSLTGVFSFEHEFPFTPAVRNGLRGFLMRGRNVKA